jgi:hypothetical protein
VNKSTNGTNVVDQKKMMKNCMAAEKAKNPGASKNDMKSTCMSQASASSGK